MRCTGALFFWLSGQGLRERDGERLGVNPQEKERPGAKHGHWVSGCSLRADKEFQRREVVSCLIF